MGKIEKILVIIPAYEDDLLIQTLENCLDNAVFPDRIVFSIGLQYKDTPVIPPRIKSSQLKLINYNVNDRPGLTRITHDLCRQQTDEDYILMINAHTRFVEKWDVLLIDSYKNLQSKTNNNKVILSNTSGCAAGPIPDVVRTVMRAEFSNQDLLDMPSLLFQYQLHLIDTEEDYILTNLATTIFFFTNSNFIEEDVFDCVSSTGCVESNLSFYSYICGWDIYCPVNFNFIEHVADNQWVQDIDENGLAKSVPNRDPRYWEEIEDEETGEKVWNKIWENSRSHFRTLNQHYLIWVHLLYSSNTGLLAKYHWQVERSPESFFEALGLHEGYKERIKHNDVFIDEIFNKVMK